MSRESGWYWTKTGWPVWVPRWWDRHCERFFGDSGLVNQMNGVAEIGPRIPNPHDTPPVTLDDELRVAQAVKKELGVSWASLNIHSDGDVSLCVPGNELVFTGISIDTASSKLRRALDYLDGKTERTIVDVLKGES